jgi:hypothetical protein
MERRRIVSYIGLLKTTNPMYFEGGSTLMIFHSVKGGVIGNQCDGEKGIQ